MYVYNYLTRRLFLRVWNKETEPFMEKTKAKMPYFSKERMSRIPSAVFLSLVISLIIFVVAPYEIYCNNLAEFKFSLGDFIGLLTLYGLTITVGLSAILFFVPKCVYTYLYPGCVGFALMLFIQTNFLNGGLNSLAGDDMEAGTSIGTYILNTSIWVIVIGGIIFLYKFAKTRSITATAALIGIIAICSSQVVNFVVATVSTEGVFDSAIDRVYGEYSDSPRFITDKDLEKIGSDRNVIMFCVDSMDTDLYTEPAMQKYPEVFAKLDGFTFYNDAISIYGNTFPAVGYLMSGIEYGNDNHRDYFNDVYNNNKTLSVLHDAGYSIKLFSEYYYDYYNANELPEYVDNIIETTTDNLIVSIRKPFKFGLAITKMSLYRSLPFILKDAVGKMNSDTCNDYIEYRGDDFGEYDSWEYDNKVVYDKIKDKVGEFAATSEKNFTFIHISGPHAAEHDENWKKNNGVKTTEDYVVSARNSIELITAYLDCMKEVSPEIYHNSTIIIVGDHGKVDGRTKMFDESMLTALFVKPAGVSGEALKTSSAPVSHENLWATIFESEGIEYDEELFGESIFDIERLSAAEWATYERQFIWNKRRIGLGSYDSVIYKIVGEARDFDNWSVDKITFFDHPLFAN